MARESRIVRLGDEPVGLIVQVRKLRTRNDMVWVPVPDLYDGMPVREIETELGSFYDAVLAAFVVARFALEERRDVPN